MTNNEPDVRPYFRSWGKSKTNDDGSVDFHLLPYHCLDAAAVGITILKKDLALFRRVKSITGYDDSALLNLCTLFFGLHDLGKFSDSFQSRRPEISSILGAKIEKKRYTIYHDVLGFHIWANPVHDHQMR